MINVMHSMNKPLDPQLWHACAGGMAQIPPENSKVYYFPQGHAEHANKNVDFGVFPRIPSLILCRVSSIKYLADAESDEVYARIRLVPLSGNGFGDVNDDDDGIGFLGFDKNEEKEKTNSFAKTLTQSDANNGGGFSVPRYCAETIFPRLDYSAEPPVQTILAKDVHGEVWKFRHIYRGTPRRHLLTTGWSNFVNQKKLVAGDSIVFLRAENGDLCVGIRRAKRGIGGGPEVVSCGWNANCGSPLYRGFSEFLGENGSLCIGNGKKGDGACKLGLNLRAESVVEAANLAAKGQPFEVVYYPRASTPEFVVRESSVRDAMRVHWCAGMRFKMAFETEDSSRISWFMGTISSVQVDDPIHWPNSPWRLLQVVWDEPDLLQNVKRVNPWLVELVSSIPASHLSPFSPPRKRPRIPQPSEFPLGQLPLPTLLSNPISPFCCLPDNIATGLQGTRHAQIELSQSDLQFKKLQPFDFKLLDYANNRFQNPNSDALSCSLKNGSPTRKLNKNGDAKMANFRLFGQPILTAEQVSRSYSVDTEGNSLSDGNHETMANVSNGSGSAVIQNFPPEASSDGEFPRFSDQKLDLGLGTGHCKVFVESEDVGRILDLSVLGSYEEMYRRLGAMFGMERSEMTSNVLYTDAEGATKHTGDEPFSDFVKKARRLTILTDSGSVNLGN
ncbi:auxin response factor 18-like [Sesamum indicum]|uniref:Auxin response factor n=1 Tax=Sesamum indicum TaxID=4182 RepID=A0A6I9T0W9_SESIN|nr:auxin response factor 18-like [Sesamum indicum]